MEINESNELGEQDRISELPNDLILQILSFLDMSSVIQTTLLSKRWEHLWRSMFVLQFDQAAFEVLPIVTKGSFEEFVQWVLTRRDECNIEAFDIYSTSENKNLIVSWIMLVLKHHVRHMSISFPECWLCLPEAVFKCDSLKSLRVPRPLCRGGGFGIPSGIDYTKLVILDLQDCRFSKGGDEKDNRLVLNLPVLEELRLKMCEMVQSFTVLAPQLKTFEYMQHFDQVMGYQIFLNTPSLESFDCSDFTEHDQKFFFLSDLSALIKAHIATWTGVFDEYVMEYADPAFNLLGQMHNAKEMDLVGEFIAILSESSQLNNSPNTVRHNLLSLKLTIMRSQRSAYTFYYILSASSNIEYLEVELKEVPDGWFGQFEEDHDSQSMRENLLDCSMEKLKIIKLRNVKDSQFDCAITSDLMNISEKLEKLIVCLDMTEDHDNEDLVKDVLAHLNQYKRESVTVELRSN